MRQEQDVNVETYQARATSVHNPFFFAIHKLYLERKSGWQSRLYLHFKLDQVHEPDLKKFINAMALPLSKMGVQIIKDVYVATEDDTGDPLLVCRMILDDFKKMDPTVLLSHIAATLGTPSITTPKLIVRAQLLEFPCRVSALQLMN